MKGFRAALVGTTILIAFSGVAAEAQTKLRVSGHFPAGHTASQGMAVMNEELEKLTSGEVAIDYFPDELLGGSFEGVEQVRTGQIDIDLNGPEWYGKVVPELEVLNLPFLANSDAQAYCIINSGLGDYLEEKMAEKGLVILGWMANGIRHMTNNARPVTSMADISGLKIRTPPSETYLETFRALGANATPIDINELYQALQQGVVDGQENPYDNTLNRKFYEVQKYLSNTGHFFSWAWLVMNQGSYDGLSEEQRAALHESADMAVEWQRQLASENNRKALQSLIDQGMQYDELPPEVFEEFREAVTPVYDTARGRAGDAAVDRALEVAQGCV